MSMASESANERSRDEVEHALYTCKMVFDMIDCAAKELEEVRELATGEPYFKGEIIETETKIIRLFAKQISVKRSLFRDRRAIPAEIRFYPSVSQFFRVLGFSPLVAEQCNQVRRTLELDSTSQCYAEEQDALTLELLMNTPASEVHERFILQFSNTLNCEQIDTLLVALGCLRTAVELLDSGAGQPHTAPRAGVESSHDEIDASLTDSSSHSGDSVGRRADVNDLDSAAGSGAVADGDSAGRGVSLHWSYLEPAARVVCPFAHAQRARNESPSGRSSPQSANRDRVNTVSGASGTTCRTNSPKASHAVSMGQTSAAHRTAHGGRTSVSSLPNSGPMFNALPSGGVFTLPNGPGALMPSMAPGSAAFPLSMAMVNAGPLALGANSASTLSTFSGSSGYASSPYCSVPPTPSAFTKTTSAAGGASTMPKQTPPASPHCVRHVAVAHGDALNVTRGTRKERQMAPGGATPPAKSKSRFLLNLNPGFPLIKSKSQESQLGARVQHDLPPYPLVDFPMGTNSNTAAFVTQQLNYATTRRTKKKPNNLKISGSHEALNSKNVNVDGDTESVYGGAPPLSAAPYLQHATYLHLTANAAAGVPQDDNVSIASGQSVGGVSLQVPLKSPNVFYPPAYQVQVAANASAQHCFESVKVAFGGLCDVCRKRLLLCKAKICTSCRFKCHRDCAAKLPPGSTCAALDRDGDSYSAFESCSVNASPRRANKKKPGVDSFSRSPVHMARTAAYPISNSSSHEAQLNSLQSAYAAQRQTSTSSSLAHTVASNSQSSQQDEHTTLPGSSSNSSAHSTAPSSPLGNTDGDIESASNRRPATSSSSGANLSAASAQPSPFPSTPSGYFQFPPPTGMLSSAASAPASSQPNTDEAGNAGNRSAFVISPAGANIPAVTVTNPPTLNTACMTPGVGRERTQAGASKWDADEQQQQLVGTNSSNDSDKTLIDSSESDRLAPLRADSVDSPDDGVSLSSGVGISLQSGLSRTVSISATLKEWDIPFESLQRKQVIGVGRFATVYRGNWHGDCAIKVFDMSDAHCEAQLQTFKLEVAVLKKTRHENLVLFMGACMKPPNLAIVTSLCRGPEHTLFHKIHVLKDKLPLNRAALIASQITQGMSYLHAKRVLHKDLRTKNIFMEGAKVVISDYGLFNVTRFCTAHTQLLSASWLCYLAPEIVRSIAVTDTGAVRFLPPDAVQSQSPSATLDASTPGYDDSNSDVELSATGGHSGPNDYDPFTTQSDVFAFGTVWFELLVSDWPFREQAADSIIWKIATGAKPEISELQCNKESKALFLACWSHDAQRRPPFTAIYQALERLPKKGLARAPSHPVTRCAEALY